MIVQHWASINIVSVKTLGITSVFLRHLNSEKRKSLNAMISKSNIEDFNSCFVGTFHPIIDISCYNALPYSTQHRH